ERLAAGLDGLEAGGGLQPVDADPGGGDDAAGGPGHLGADAVALDEHDLHGSLLPDRMPTAPGTGQPEIRTPARVVGSRVRGQRTENRSQRAEIRTESSQTLGSLASDRSEEHTSELQS